MEEVLGVLGACGLLAGLLGLASGSIGGPILIGAGVAALICSRIERWRNNRMARKRSTEPQVDPASAALAPTLFVKFEEDKDYDDGGYLTVAKELDGLVERDTTVVGVYVLQEVKRYKLDVHDISTVVLSTSSEAN